MGGGEDVIRGGGVLALDLRNLTTLASDTGALDLDFGSASAVTINVGATGSDVFTTITGSEDDDVLALYSTVDDSVAELGVVTGVETISLEYDDGISGTVLLINADSLSDGMTVVGDDGNEVIRANEDGVDVSQVELVGIESFDVNGVEVTASSAALAGLEIDNDVAGGELTITDTAVSLDFGDIGGALEVIFSASTGVNASIGDMVDTAAVTLTFGAGNDSLDLTDATISGNADSAVSLGRGNDSLRFGDTIANGGAQGGVDGSFGTDRLLVEGSVAAGDIDSAIFTNFEVLALATSESGDITIELGAGDVDVGTIDLSADTDTDGSNTVTLTAYDGGAITVVGSRDADDVTTGASSATVQAGLGNDTITVTGAALATALEAQSFSLSGGGGDDVFELLEDWATAGVGQHAILITDYSGDTIDIDATVVGTAGGNGTVELAQSVAQSIVNDAEPTSLAGALSALSREAFARDANLVTVFQFEGNTYLYVDGDAVDADFDSEQDFYITLTGLVTVDMADVTSFV